MDLDVDMWYINNVGIFGKIINKIINMDDLGSGRKISVNKW